MIGLGSAALRIYIALEPQDMRKSFGGLSDLAMGHLKETLSKDALFVFTNKRRTRVKLLYFDGTGILSVSQALGSRHVQLAEALHEEPAKNVPEHGSSRASARWRGSEGSEFSSLV